MSGELQKCYNFIAGEECAAQGNEWIDLDCPATGEVFCKIARSRAVDVERAVDAAIAAQTAWRATTFHQRADILEKIADGIKVRCL